MKSEELYPSFSTCYHCGKVLIEDDGEDGCSKGRVCKIVHSPAKDLSFLDWHIEVNDGAMGWLGDGVNPFVSKSSQIPISLLGGSAQIVLISCRMKTAKQIPKQRKVMATMEIK